MPHTIPTRLYVAVNINGQGHFRHLTDGGEGVRAGCNSPPVALVLMLARMVGCRGVNGWLASSLWNFSFSSTSSLPHPSHSHSPSSWLSSFPHTQHSPQDSYPQDSSAASAVLQGKAARSENEIGLREPQSQPLPPHPTVLTETRSRERSLTAPPESPQPPCHPFCFGISGYQARTLRAKH